MSQPLRYRVTGNVEAQFEPGSKGRVLKNLLGVTSVREMELAETRLLLETYRVCTNRFSPTHRFTERDLRVLHRLWLGAIYPWAGKYRSVDISKGGHRFAVPRLIPKLMMDWSMGPLRRHTPCRGKSPGQLAAALAEVHVELVLIHPFREGNGRVARLVSDLMVRQAGRPWLSYKAIEGTRRKKYFAAVTAGLDRDYRPMGRIFSELLSESK